MNIDVNDFLKRLSESLINFMPRLITAIVILVVGYFAIKLFRLFMRRMMNRREDMDPTLIKFLMDLITWVLRILLFIIVIGQLGVETSSFVAIIGAAGLAIGLALQGSLANFAGGILIILFKPFRVGDFIEAQGEGGTVTEIQILYTRMLTPNNQVVFLPNGSLSNNNIKNYSSEPIRKGEIIIGVGYSSDLQHVKSVLLRLIEAEKAILKEPQATVRVKDLADSSINFQVFVWANNGDFWQMLSDFKEAVKYEFDREGIEIPFPQTDLNIKEIPLNKSKE